MTKNPIKKSVMNWVIGHLIVAALYSTLSYCPVQWQYMYDMSLEFWENLQYNISILVTYDLLIMLTLWPFL